MQHEPDEEHAHRRPAMLVGLGGSCACSVALASLSMLGVLGPWSSLVLITLASCFVAFQVPAFESLTAVLVSPARRTRANGLVQLGRGFAQLVAPATAGFLLPVRTQAAARRCRDGGCAWPLWPH